MYKILFLTTFYHRAFIFRDLLNSIEHDCGYNIKVYNAAVYNDVVYDKYKEIMDEKVIHHECYSRIDSFLFFIKRNKIIRDMRLSVDLDEYDLVHAHSLMTCGYVAMRWKKNKDVRYIVSIRNTDINVHLRIPFMKLIARKIVHEAAGIHFLSHAYRDYFINNIIPKKEKKQFEEKSFVIPNGVEDYWLQNRFYRQVDEDNKKNVKLLFVGKIDKNKNVRTILKSCDLLIKEGYLVELTAIGQIVNKSVLKILNKKEYVTVYRYMTKEELIVQYRCHDIFIMPSKNETFGRVYVEAMSQGMPVIYTRGQGFDGQFSEGVVGYSVNCIDFREIAQKVKLILESYTLISKNCTDSAKNYSWEKIGKQYTLYYDKILR